MDESIIFSEDVKAYFSSHASLAALGRKVSKRKVFEPIAEKVRIAQKTVKYRPSEKLMDAFISLLAGAQGLVEINKRLKGLQMKDTLKPGLEHTFSFVVSKEKTVPISNISCG